jgi:glycosyltransferase involved in cell wall biosynthesis
LSELNLVWRPSVVAPVAVLLCTYNGDPYLAVQLDSIFGQLACTPVVVVSDDGSKDDTQALLTHYANYPHISWRSGPAQGFVRNFFSLINDSSITGEFFALADQDDLWLADHLSRALQALAAVPAGVPGLYASRTQLINAADQHIGWSPYHTCPPAFRNALIQNIASGNTMVFNRAARDLLAKLGAHAMPVWHDWALYQVVTACGGQVFYNQEPSVRYRQHGGNAIGAQWTLASRWHRVRQLLRARFRDWNTQNLHALEGIAEPMTPANRALMARFAEVRQRRTPWGRVLGVYQLGLYRQTRLGQLGLYVAAFFKLM